ncbi:unnamed protein product [Fraxinus pennsylvanica]|uniref:Uncharacterized protein n=1 Tax=Fraxinus pennsylvanica TaxID=56036 RepID=A0AAD2A4X6_9LAMI|nr:unnamed protein product [Fraxinus pennsylvanica]
MCCLRPRAILQFFDEEKFKEAVHKFALRTGRRFRARRMLLLFETPMGFSLFKVLDEGKLSKIEDLWNEFSIAAFMTRIKSSISVQLQIEPLESTTSNTADDSSLEPQNQTKPEVDLIPAIPKEEAGTNLFNMNSDDKNKVDAGELYTKRKFELMVSAYSTITTHDTALFLRLNDNDAANCCLKFRCMWKLGGGLQYLGLDGKKSSFSFDVTRRATYCESTTVEETNFLEGLDIGVHSLAKVDSVDFEYGI